MLTMKIVIVGYGEMLEALIEGVSKTEHEIVGVFRRENVMYNPVSRFLHDAIKPSPDFNLVRNLNLHDIYASSINSEKFIREIKKLEADIILVGSWSEKFSAQTINTPKIACINVHPSLLPKYRGPNPYYQVILNNEAFTGITFHIMDINYDSGAILYQKQVEVRPKDTGKSLRLRCCDTVKREVKIFLSDFEDKLQNRISQNESQATYQSQITLKDCILDFTQEPSDEIDRKIRGLNPWLDCFIPYGNQFFGFSKYKLHSSMTPKEPANIVKKTKNSLYVACADGKVMEFSDVKIKTIFPKQVTKFYLKKIIKTNTKAV